MCRYRSGIIFKNRVQLAPAYNDSHSSLLRTMSIEDTTENAMRLFVRAELYPVDGDRATDPKTWKYVVDQDVIPDWYEEDPGKYEKEFRTAVEIWNQNFNVNIMERSWSKIKIDDNYTYYLLNGTDGGCHFGNKNDYSISNIREKVNGSELTKDLKKVFGDKLVPLPLDLTLLDGLKDYRTFEGDILGILDLILFSECRENIPNTKSYWLSPSKSIPEVYRVDSLYVDPHGNIFFGGDFKTGIRLFFILAS